MGKRRRAREITIQFLYQYESQAEFTSEGVNREEVVKLFWAARESERDDGDVLRFANSLISGACDNLQSIDDVLSKYSKHWRISRMSKTDRNVLRMAAYELVYLRDIPPPVTINEAVELAKKYGTEESGAFVNGILDRIRQALESGEL
ncbi:MAG: transcription antitermination factor NusB [Deltaproteobacteria bacterium]